MKKIIFLSVLSLLFSGASMVMADISVKVPATFTLKLNETATTDYLYMQIKLQKIGAYEYEAMLYPEKVFKNVEINVSAPGGCGPDEVTNWINTPRCLGMPAFETNYTIGEGSSVQALGLKITVNSIGSDSATFSVMMVDGEPPVYPIPEPSPGGIACTMEAKLCPDGSYVGRTGPNCEFSACPSGVGGGSSGSVTFPSTFNLPSGQTIVTTERIEASGEADAYYEITTEREARLFFIFSVTVETTYSVNTETGESKVTERPWWNFLAW